MTGKYEAALEFYKILLDNPDDFEVTTDSGRDHNEYTISHKYKLVCIKINVESGGILSVVPAAIGKSINFVDGPTLVNLIKFANSWLERRKIENQIKSDNEAIAELRSHYE